MSSVRCSNSLLQHVPDADLAHLVERHLAKVEVASSSLVIRSIALYYLFHYKAHKERSCVLYFFTLSPSLHLWARIITYKRIIPKQKNPPSGVLTGDFSIGVKMKK